MDIYRKNDCLIASSKDLGAGWEQYCLFVSDVHFDSKHCDRGLLKKHLDQAKKRNAKIFIFGDFFDAMGGKLDKRTTKGDIRQEYCTATYFDDIVDDAAKFLEPYKGNIALMSMGNHESSVLMHHETNILGRLCAKLGVNEGKYAGFVRFQFEAHGSGRSSRTLYYTHGSGGASPVTRGVISSQRRQHDILAQLYVSGHTHAEYLVPRPITVLNEQGCVEVRKCVHISLGCYLQTHMEGGWADHKGFGAASIGGAWLRWYYERGKDRGDRIKLETTLAD